MFNFIEPPDLHPASRVYAQEVGVLDTLLRPPENDHFIHPCSRIKTYLPASHVPADRAKK